MSESPSDPEPVVPLHGCAGVDELDVAGVLAAAGQAMADRHAAEVLALEVDLQFAVLHAGPPPAPDGPLDGTTRLVRLGGAGTPKVQDLPICELAIARGLHVTSARHHLADSLDLAHRLPRLSASRRAGRGAVWVARRIAS